MIERILIGVSEGRSVAAMLREDAMPSSGTFWTWHLHDPDLQSALACARISGVEALLDECRDIADGDDVDLAGAAPGPAFAKAMSRADVRRAKLRVETRVKMAQMLAPRKYGPKLDLTSGGEKLRGDAPTDKAERVLEMLKTVHEREPSGVAPDIAALLS